ncbi:hypothetical protein ACLOJK_022460 [Asimina triloba]
MQGLFGGRGGLEFHARIIWENRMGGLHQEVVSTLFRIIHDDLRFCDGLYLIKFLTCSPMNSPAFESRLGGIRNPSIQNPPVEFFVKV